MLELCVIFPSNSLIPNTPLGRIVVLHPCSELFLNCFIDMYDPKISSRGWGQKVSDHPAF